ncbi:zinc-binding dehydrogenase [Streptomyces sp. NPDC094034]|uniref:zinc-binding dehydrogenase n=1 Tax=Streptomyces sp. NPDC094034 TaxID=3155309 RepID=UPI00332FA385
MAERVRASHPGGIDAVLDLTRDPDRFRAYAGLVRGGGAAVSAALIAPPDLLASERIAVTNFQLRDKPDLLARITAEAAAGRLTVPIQRTIGLDEVPEALSRLTAGGARGKTVVRIRP